MDTHSRDNEAIGGEVATALIIAVQKSRGTDAAVGYARGMILAAVGAISAATHNTPAEELTALMPAFESI